MAIDRHDDFRVAGGQMERLANADKTRSNLAQLVHGIADD